MKSSERKRAYNRQRYKNDAVRAKALAATRRWALENPERYAEIRRDASFRHRLKKFGLTVEQYETMLAAQGYRCAICRTDDPGVGKEKRRGSWNVDHDHATGEMRGLLCRGCNIALGAVKDNPVTLAAMIAYLKKCFLRRICGRFSSPWLIHFGFCICC
jgi:hypothetical protein